MAVYFVTGSLGGGKSLAAMWKIDEYLRRGRKIATNMNLHLEYLCGADNKNSRVIRVPDAPSIQDLQAIGYGADVSGDKNHGLLVLDELGAWFNSRDFADKGRKDVIKYCIHLRKKRWDVLFLVQDFSMVDKQLRGNITQYLVTCQNAHDFWFFRILPKFHIGTVRLKTKIKTGSWWYRGKHLFPAYDTEQLYFTSDQVTSENDLFVDDDLNEREKAYMELNGLYSLLPPFYRGEQVRADIRRRARADYVGRIKFIALLFLLWGNFKLYTPDFGMPSLPIVSRFIGGGEVVQDVAGTNDPDVDAAPVVPVAELPTEEPATPLTFADFFAGYRIRSVARFGGDYRYVFESPEGEGVTDAWLADAGVRVVPRSIDRVMLEGPDGSVLAVYRE